MSGTQCVHHPDLTFMMPNKTVGPVSITSHIAADGKTTQEPLGIEMPNPNLKLYTNTLGDYASYPVRMPSAEAKVPKPLPPASLYQRSTRRPWDITTQQFSAMMNKRKSWTVVTVGVLFGAVYPFIPKPNASVDGARPGFGLTSNYGTGLPAPKKDTSFAGL
eukprot:TRINITY_DN22950_c0_g1_i1.p1 TRINITY_DN22950_c0_g1~~TRINITY_DN22950_c0_g1_i1.p1  ORF type:complete len:188 (+),score=52.05 TRINITY_DN22950_c0_g1_i1:79-564(+)